MLPGFFLEIQEVVPNAPGFLTLDRTGIHWDPLGADSGAACLRLGPSMVSTHRAEGEETRGLEFLVYFPLDIRRQENGSSYESKSKYKTSLFLWTELSDWTVTLTRRSHC